MFVSIFTQFYSGYCRSAVLNLSIYIPLTHFEIFHISLNNPIFFFTYQQIKYFTFTKPFIIKTIFSLIKKCLTGWEALF